MSDQIANSLSLLQADFSVYYQKLRHYHWNVRGPMFFELHRKFEELYLDAALKVDELAERILALGFAPPSTLKQQLEMTRLKEDEGRPDAIEMVRHVEQDMDALTGWLREVVGLASEEGDTATANMLDSMADAQEKQAWMLRAFLSGRV